MSVVQTTNQFMQLTSCRVVSISNLSANYFNGPTGNGVGATLTSVSPASLVIDSITVSVNDRVLLVGQSLAGQNGIYVVISPGSAGEFWVLQRSGDFQCAEQLQPGQYLTIFDGDTLAGSIYTLINPFPQVFGVSAINFTESDSPASGIYLQRVNNLDDVTNPVLSLSNIGGLPLAGGAMTGPLILSGNATNPLGAVTLQQLAASGVTIWQTDTVTPINLVVDTGHFANCGTLLTYVLPPVSIVGNMVRIAWQNASGWKISQGAGQQIIYGNTQTTLGTGGSLASSMQGDCVELVCQVANTVWEVLTSQGNLTVV